MQREYWLSIIVAGLFAPSLALAAISCPEMPRAVTETGRDVKSDISASIGSLGKIKAGEVGVRTEVAVKAIFEKFPTSINSWRFKLWLQPTARYLTLPPFLIPKS